LKGAGLIGTTSTADSRVEIAVKRLSKSWLGLALLWLVSGGVLTGCGVNDIPTKDEAVKAAWSQVLNQYQRRADLIPNLVETVKGASNFERETLQAVIEARAKVAQMKLPDNVLTDPNAFQTFQQIQGQLTGALSRLLVTVERYPELKANQNYVALQSQLEGTENRIAVARRDYIQSVQDYNTEIRTFPGRIWASVLYRDAQIKQNFAPDDPSITTAPRIKFG
jgi:LemA protein